LRAPSAGSVVRVAEPGHPADPRNSGQGAHRAGSRLTIAPMITDVST
jgi:hypothetical protein